MSFYGKKSSPIIGRRVAVLLFFALLKTTTAMTLRTRQPEEKILWVVRSDGMLEDDDIVYGKRRHSDFYVDFPSGFGTPKTAEVKSVTFPNYVYNVYDRSNNMLAFWKPNPLSVGFPDYVNIPTQTYTNLTEFYSTIKDNLDCEYHSSKYGDRNTIFEIQDDDTLHITQYPGIRIINLDYSTHLSQAAPSIAGGTTQPTSIIETLFGETWTTSHVAYTGSDGQAVLTAIGEAPPNTGIWYVGYERDIVSDSITIDETNNQFGIITQANGYVDILATATIPSGTYDRVETTFVPADSSNFDISGDDFFYPSLSEAIFLAFQRLNLGFDCYALCRGRLPGDSATTSLLDLIATADDPKRGRWFISFEHAITPSLTLNIRADTANKLLGLEYPPNFENYIARVPSAGGYCVADVKHKIRLGPLPQGSFDYSGTYYINTSFTPVGLTGVTYIYYMSALEELYGGTSFHTVNPTNFSFTLSGSGTITELKSAFETSMTLPLSGLAFPRIEVVDNYLEISLDTTSGLQYTTPFFISFTDPSIDYDLLTNTQIATGLALSEKMKKNGMLYICSSDGNLFESYGRVQNLDSNIYDKNYAQFSLTEYNSGVPTGSNTVILKSGFYTKDDLISAINDAFIAIQAGLTPFNVLPVIAFDDTSGLFSITPDTTPTVYTFSFRGTSFYNLQRTLGFMGDYGDYYKYINQETLYANSVPNLNPKVVYLQSNMVKGYRSSYISNEIELPSCLAAIEINRGRGGIVTFKGSSEEGSIYPGVKITSVDPTAIYNGKINFKLINERGVPLEEDAGPMMIVLELTF